MKLTLRDWRAIVAVLLLPALTAALAIWSISGRAQRFDHVPAAIVNHDTGVMMKLDGKEQRVPLGRELAAALMYPPQKPQTNLNWQLVTEERAVEGLSRGDFQAIVTIPEGFSRSVSSIGTPEATAAIISVTSNDASSELMGVVSSQIAQAAARSLGSTFTEKMLDKIYLGFNQLADQFGEISDGANQIKDGTTALGAGAGALNEGLEQLQSGSAQLAQGLGEAGSGASQLAAGAGSVQSGAAQLAAGAQELHSGLRAIEDGLRGNAHSQGLVAGTAALDQAVNGPGGLAQGSAALAEGNAKLADGVDKLVTSIQKVTGPLAELEGLLPDDLLEKLPDPTELNAALDRLEAALQDSHSFLLYLRAQIEGDGQRPGALNQLRQALAQCQANATGPDDPQCQAIQAAIDALEQALNSWPEEDEELDAALAQIRQLAEDLGLSDLRKELAAFSEELAQFLKDLEASGGISGMNAQLDELRQGAKELADGSAALAEGINGDPGLASGISQLHRGLVALQKGISGDGSEPGAVDGAAQLMQGANHLRDGIAELRWGAGELSEGINQSAAGAQSLADGASTAKDGSASLYAGINELIAGSSLFASQIEDGAKQIPTYTDAERTRIVDMAAIPVRTEEAKLNAITAQANSIFPWAAALVLWLGAFSIYLAMPGLRRRAIASSDSPRRVAWVSLRPALAMSFVQVAATIVVSHLLGVRPRSLLMTTALLVVGAVTFVTLNQALLSVAGARLGRILALGFLVVQVVSLGGIVPIQTAPPLFQSLSTVLPLSILSTGLGHTVFGGQLTTVLGSVTPLLAWGCAALIFTVIAASKARFVEAKQLLGLSA